MAFFGTMASVLDKLTGSGTTRLVVNKLISDYGTLSQLAIDKDKKQIRAQFQLKGERSPINIDLNNYELQKSALVVKSAKADKPWAQAVLDNLLIDRAIEIPPEYIDIINELL